MCPNIFVRSLLIQLVLETIVQYFQHYIDFIHLQALLEGNQQYLEDSTELYKFLAGLIYSGKNFMISQEEHIFNDQMLQQKFT